MSWRRSLLADPHNELAVAMIKDSQIVGRTLSENLLTHHMIIFITQRASVIHCPVSAISLGEGVKEKALKNHVIIMDHKDPAFIQGLAVIMMFPWPLNKTRSLYKTSRNLR